MLCSGASTTRAESAANSVFAGTSASSSRLKSAPSGAPSTAIFRVCVPTFSTMPFTRKSWSVARWVHSTGSFLPSRVAVSVRSTTSFSAASAVCRLPRNTRSLTLPPSLANPAVSTDSDWFMIENVQEKRLSSVNLASSIFWGNTSIV